MNKKREYDEEQIHDDDLLYRRFHSISLGSDGRVDYSNIYAIRYRRTRPRNLCRSGRENDPEKTLAAVPRALAPVLGLSVLKAGDVRRLGFTVRHNPNRKNRAHCIIEGAKTEADCWSLAEITRVHTLPRGEASDVSETEENEE